MNNDHDPDKVMATMLFNRWVEEDMSSTDAADLTRRTCERCNVYIDAEFYGDLVRRDLREPITAKSA